MFCGFNGLFEAYQVRRTAKRMGPKAAHVRGVLLAVDEIKVSAAEMLAQEH